MDKSTKISNISYGPSRIADNLIHTMEFSNNIFSKLTKDGFCECALKVFRYQYGHNEIYRQFADMLGIAGRQVERIDQIPFLPISFFKSHKVISGKKEPEKIFSSSGTTASVKSHHYVTDLSVYRQSLISGFTKFYGDPGKYEILALMQSPEQNPGSSLVFMVKELIAQNNQDQDVFFINRFSELSERLTQPPASGEKRFIIGLTYALMDFAEQYPVSLTGSIIVETGGMKGRREELTREELHAFLKERFMVDAIHSEYGMTELLSQAWSRGNSIFSAPSCMRILIREPNDPFSFLPNGRTGGINIIDLANFNSCSFIATEDLGKQYSDGTFEVLGRFDNSDIRGCSLMMG